MSPPHIPETQSLNLQCTSRLFYVPIEIRHAIYIHLINTAGVHITRTEQGEIRLSPCTGPNLDAEYTGHERRPNNSSTLDRLFARRMASSWGPHWECEEITLKTEAVSDGENEAGWGRDGVVLRICKRMHLEVVELMTKLVCFHVTDLDTLGALFETAGISASELSFSASYNFKNSFLPRITKLAITLRLPLTIFEALDGLQANEDEPIIWSAPFLKITQLETLRSLRIWLDHNAKAYWTVVNERAILSRLKPLASIPHLDLSFDLPNLHPKLEDPERHFTEEDTDSSDLISVSPFKIRRRLRQRYHAGKTDMGNYWANYTLDFPFLLDTFLFRGRPLAEREYLERRMWRSGVDVLLLLAQLRMYICNI